MNVDDVELSTFGDPDPVPSRIPRYHVGCGLLVTSKHMNLAKFVEQQLVRVCIGSLQL